jgi:holo-[acyl-carrier protein] synthase
MIRNGVDLIEIDRLENINPKIRERFINRVFTDQEKLICGNNYSCYSGRFAAKEAVAKALGTGIGEIHWKDIEILKGKQGQPVINLHGKAKEKEIELGIINWSISISHGRSMAIAFVIAQ